jgi:hypothetical protein
MTVSRVLPVPVTEVWRVFADPRTRVGFGDVIDVDPLTVCPRGVVEPGQRWRETRRTTTGATVTEELAVVAVDEGRSCTVALADAGGSGELTYQFRGVPAGTAVTISTERPRAGLLGFFVGGLAARTAEGSLRGELAALAGACRAAHAAA